MVSVYGVAASVSLLGKKPLFISFFKFSYLFYTVPNVGKYFPQIANQLTCGLTKLVRLADFPQKWQFADLRFAEPIFCADPLIHKFFRLIR
jgi:hypothetical protein